MNKLKEHLEQLAPSSVNLTIPTNDYSHIELTPEETAEALRVAREVKDAEIRKRDWMAKVKAVPTYRTYTALELWTYLKATRSATGKPYRIDAENKEQVKQVLYYFAGDPTFNGDLKKGLMLMGANGTGKSHLMATFVQNQIQSYAVVSARTVENAWIDESKDEAGSVIKRYSSMLPVSDNVNMFGHKEIGFCFDDLGSESVPSKKYGEEKNVMAEILLNRYDSKLPFKATHITTNMNLAKFEQTYGTRVRDRFREMFNLIIFNGNSRR